MSPGLRLEPFYPQLSDCILIHCGDEISHEDVEKFIQKFFKVVKESHNCRMSGKT